MSPSQEKQKKAEAPFQTLIVPKLQRCWDSKNPPTGTPEWPHTLFHDPVTTSLPKDAHSLWSCSNALLHLLCLPTALQPPEKVVAPFLTTRKGGNRLLTWCSLWGPQSLPSPGTSWGWYQSYRGGSAASSARPGRWLWWWTRLPAQEARGKWLCFQKRRKGKQ